MIKNISNFDNAQFKERYQSLYVDLQVRAGEYSQLLYPMIFLLRRAIFVVLATMKDEYPHFQI